MSYEERMEAGNDYIAERAAELVASGDIDVDYDATLDIEAGSYDIPALRRAAAILAERNFTLCPALLRRLAEVLEFEST